MSKLMPLFLGGSMMLCAGAPALADDIGSSFPAKLPKLTASVLHAAAGRMQQAGAQPAEATPTPASIAAVEGKVRYRLAADKPWEAAKVGANLTEGAEIETSIRSMVQVRIGAGQVLTIDRASRVALREAISRSGTDKTTVDLPYGRVKFDVSSATVANDVQISAPDATLAVKGTTGYMDVTAGHPTTAYGGEGNTGTFTMSYEGGTEASVDGEAESNSDSPSPAETGLGSTQLDTGAVGARDGDESAVVNRSPGGGDSIKILTGGGTSVIPSTPPPNTGGGGDLFFIRFGEGKTLELVSENPLVAGSGAVRRSGEAFSNSLSLGVSFSGLAIGPGSVSGHRDLLRLEADSGGWRLLGLDLDEEGSVFSLRAESDKQASVPQLFGLGTIGSRMFTGGFGDDGDPFGIFEIAFDGSTTQRMQLPFLNMGTDIAGAPQRGTVWVYGNTFSGEGLPTGALFNGAFFEMDPRTNMMVSVSGPLTFSANTVFSDGLTASDFDGARVVSMAYVGNRLIVEVDTYSTNHVVLVINPFAVPGQTVILSASRRDGLRPGFASESIGTPANSRFIGSATSAIDTSIPSLFAQMAYTSSAAIAPFFHLLIFDQVIDTAVDSSACASQAAPIDLLPFLFSHVNQTSGVGQVVFDYRESLPFGHPCLRPGQMGFMPPIVYLDEQSRLLGRDLNDVEYVLGQNITGYSLFPGLAGLAFVGDPNDGSRTLFRFDTATIGMATLQQLSPFGNNGNFTTVDVYSTGDLLFGLGAIGNNLYTGRINSGGFGFDFRIELLGSSGTLIQQMALPFADIIGDFTGSNERGSLFLIGDTNPGVQSSILTASVWEVDPRNNYVIDVDRLTLSAATQTGPGVPSVNVLMTHDIQVTGTAFVNGILVASVIDLDDNNRRYFVQIDPSASGTAGNPTVRRIFEYAGFLDALASESAVAPPAPFNVVAGAGNIDTFIGPFADTAYSPSAAASTPFREMVRTAIFSSSIAESACQLALNSAPLTTTLATALNQHVNTTSGVGRAVQQLRDSLAPDHPCRVPSPTFAQERGPGRQFGFGSATQLPPGFGGQGPATPQIVTPRIPVVSARQLAGEFAHIVAANTDGPTMLPPEMSTATTTAIRTPRRFGDAAAGPSIGPVRTRN